MVIINSYLGGTGEVPTGYCNLLLKWNPSDGQNLNNATIRIVGAQTYTTTTDSSGNASMLVEAGAYTATAIPATGLYSVDTVAVVAESGATQVVIFNGVDSRDVVFVTPIMSGTDDSFTWVVKDTATDTAIISGTGFSEYTIISLPDGQRTITITKFGLSVSQTFTVSDSSFIVDIRQLFSYVFIDTEGLEINATISGVALGLITDPRMFMLRTAHVFSGTTSEQIEGYPIVTITPETFTPNSAEFTYHPIMVARSFLVTESTTKSLHKGKYKVLVIGGGGAGWSYGGGGGGHVAYKTVSVPNDQNITITIGQGGSGNAAGGASSFGSLASANGGSQGSGNGGDGGSGGGSYERYGGNASFGGGGGGYINGNYNGGSGKGTYGGEGGRYRSSGDYSSKPGRAIDNSDGFFNSTGSGYSGGANASTSPSGRGGGGGGYGAKGGNGLLATGSKGGGGGGGIAGGDGGDANMHGKGYGSGGFYFEAGYQQKAGGGGGLYDVDFSSLKNVGAPGAVQFMWVGRP